MNRSLADDIRSRSDAQLRDLLLERPDLAHPPPTDLTARAARAGTTASVQRALERLDTAQLQVLDAVVVVSGASRKVDEAALTGVLGAGADAHLQRLWALALLWRSAEGLRLVGMVVQVLERRPAGSGRLPRGPLLKAPPLELTSPGQDAVDASAGWWARETLRLVEDLTQAWAAAPPRTTPGARLFGSPPRFTKRRNGQP